MYAPPGNHSLDIDVAVSKGIFGDIAVLANGGREVKFCLVSAVEALCDRVVFLSGGFEFSFAGKGDGGGFDAFERGFAFLRAAQSSVLSHL